MRHEDYKEDFGARSVAIENAHAAVAPWCPFTWERAAVGGLNGIDWFNPAMFGPHAPVASPRSLSSETQP